MEGLFRLSATTDQIKDLRDAIDNGKLDFSDCNDQQILTTTFKILIKEIPEPVGTYNLYDTFAVITGKNRFRNQDNDM